MGVRIGADAEDGLDWADAAQAIVAGHSLPTAEVRDHVIEVGENSMLTRSAWIDGLGLLTKTATVFPGNRAAGRATVDGVVNLFDHRDGAPLAEVDFALLTKWKTAADSRLATSRLAPPSVGSVAVIGAGPMAGGLLEAYRSLFPDATFLVASRQRSTAAAFAARYGAEVADDVESAVRTADVVSVATTSERPVIEGAWLRPGHHVDLVGAFRPTMREADDEVMRRGRVFVDSRATTIDHIGELIEPIRSGTLSADEIVADFYDLDRFERHSDDEITVFKNGGGAHLDLMTATYIVETATP